jgi:membrane protease YdiL (CAAX protease family)
MTTNVLSHGTVQGSINHAQAGQLEQYTLWQILGIWALVAVPMALLAWVVAPAIIPYSPLHPGITHWLVIIAGMGWETIVSLVILYRELGTLRWSAIRQRIWLRTPLDPKTGQPNPRLLWWALLGVLFSFGLVGSLIGIYLDAPMAWLFPSLQPAPYMDISQLASPAFKGQWWLLGVTLVNLLLNYFLGEELIFRGILLPKMQGVFGKYDWVANAVLFGLYHLHKPWLILSTIIGSLGMTWPTRRFRSYWMGVIVHGIEGYFVVLVLAVILGILPR